MVNRIRSVYPHGLDKGFCSKFHVGSWVWQETPEEGCIGRNVVNITIKMKIKVRILYMMKVMANWKNTLFTLRNCPLPTILFFIKRQETSDNVNCDVWIN